MNQRLDEICPKVVVTEINEHFPISLPVSTLKELEKLKNFVFGNDAFVNYLKKIDGNDYKDFPLRICRAVFSNLLAETCSLTGRKNYYQIGNKEFLKTAFGLVHHKSKCFLKDFEAVISEWLRHARQRRIKQESNKE